jgi:hypothetical protein
VAEYVDVETARTLPGLRLVLPALPGPWAEGARGLFQVKRIPFARVRQEAGRPNEALRAWTGESNAPQAVFEDEPARTAWTEMIFLAERLAAEPRLLPADAEQRAQLFGLGFCLCGEQGFGWQRRLMMFHDVLSLPVEVLAEEHPARVMVARMGRRYGYSRQAAEQAPGRAAEVLQLLSAQLERQRDRGSRYFLGEGLTALDVYWAAFAALVEPLPPELCPMPDFMRGQYTLRDPAVRGAASPLLLAHRDHVYERFLGLPLDL